MGLSLQDQLLKAGIADKKQANKAKQEKRVKRKKNKGAKVTPELNQAQKERLEEARRSKELNLRLNRKKERLEKLSQVRQLIEANRLKLDKYEEPYYFKVGKKIKKVYVNDDITRKLSRGALAIVRSDDFFEIVSEKVARQIVDRDPDSLVLLHKIENKR